MSATGNTNNPEGINQYTKRGGATKAKPKKRAPKAKPLSAKTLKAMDPFGTPHGIGATVKIVNGRWVSYPTESDAKKGTRGKFW